MVPRPLKNKLDKYFLILYHLLLIEPFAFRKIYQICNVQKLNFPFYNFRFKNSENKAHIFDEFRKKFVVLKPEEWVRQHCLKYLINEKKYPKTLISVEKKLIVNGLNKRYDIVIFNPDGSIFCVIECKAPSVKVNQNAFDQIAKYNRTLNAKYLMITNGLNHYYCIIGKNNYTFLDSLPEYSLK